MQLNEAKEYLRIDGDGEDDLVSSLLLASQSYIKNGTGITPENVEQNDNLEPLYNLALKLLLSHWYENRTPEIAGTSLQKLSFSLDSIFSQLEAEYLKLKRGGKV